MSGRRPVAKIIAESLSQLDENHVVPTPLSGIRVGGRDIGDSESVLELFQSKIVLIALFVKM
jgi:hypothetical protein